MNDTDRCYLVQRHSGYHSGAWKTFAAPRRLDTAYRNLDYYDRPDRKRGGLRILDPDGAVIRQRIYGGPALQDEISFEARQLELPLFIP
jgi:hypothetical protein